MAAIFISAGAWIGASKSNGEDGNDPQTEEEEVGVWYCHDLV